MLGHLLVRAAPGEVEMPGQVLVTDPAVAELPIGFSEQPTIGFVADRDAAFVDGGVVPLAQQDQIAVTALNVPSQ